MRVLCPTAPSEKALRDLHRRVGVAPLKTLLLLSAAARFDSDAFLADTRATGTRALIVVVTLFAVFYLREYS
jgi:hypothetical protein